MLTAFGSVLCRGNQHFFDNVEVRGLGMSVHACYWSILCFSNQVWFYCIGSVFGIIDIQKKTFQITLHAGLKSDHTFLCIPSPFWQNPQHHHCVLQEPINTHCFTSVLTSSVPTYLMLQINLQQKSLIRWNLLIWLSKQQATLITRNMF